MSQLWWLYMIECQDGGIYTGIALDVEARYAQHVSGKGAKYTKMNRPRHLLAKKAYPDRSSAAQAEYAVKQLKPVDKRRFADACLG